MNNIRIIYKCNKCSKDHTIIENALLCCDQKFIEKEQILRSLQSNCPELSVSSWDCHKSFYGKCIQKSNGHDDECIFCGEPDDRQ
jgi:hypothetical protein